MRCEYCLTTQRLKDKVREDVYDEELLNRLLDGNDIDQFRDEFLAMHNYDQSEYFEDTDDNNRQKYLNSYHLKKLLISLIN